MVAKQIHITQGTPEWHTWRGTGLGASDIAALFGVSPYKTKRDLWFEKAGFGEPDDEDRSYIFQRGHEAEAEIRELFSKHVKIEISPTCFQNGFFLASLDGYAKGVGILEAKLVGKDALKKIAQGEIPEHHRIQVQSQLYTSEEDKAFYGAKAPKVKGGHIVEMGRDEKLIANIVEEGQRFMESVATGKIPEFSAQDTFFITDPTQVAVFTKLAALRANKVQIENEYADLEKMAKSFAAHQRVRCGHMSITMSERSGSVDYTRIPEVSALSDEYVESFRKKSSFIKTLRFGKE